MALSTLLAFAFLASPPQTPDHSVIYTEIPGSPTSVVPGTMGSAFDAFDEVRASPSGNHWVLTCKRDTSNGFDDVTIVDGSLLFLQAVTPLPWNVAQVWFAGWTDVNDAGHLLVVSAPLSSAIFTSELVFSADMGSSWAVRETAGGPAQGIPGASWSYFLDPRLSSNGSSGFRSQLEGMTASTDEAQHFNMSLLAQSGVTVPAGQVGSLTIGQIDFQSKGLEVSDDGAHNFTRVTLGSNKDAVLLDGNVVLEEGTTIPGAGFTRPIDHIDGVHMTPDGTWFAWGRNTSHTYRDWVVEDGTVIAQEFGPIIPGSPELWGSTSNFSGAFGFARGHTNGETLVYGTLFNGSGEWVLVRDGSEVVMRRGDPIDVDGNGLFDDNALIGSIHSMSDWTSSGDIWIICSLTTTTFGQLGDALIKLEFGTSNTTGTLFCSPADVNSTGVPTELSGSFGSGVGSDLHLEITSGPPSQFGYMLMATGRSVPGISISQGHLCLAGSLGRFNVAGGQQNSLGIFSSSGVFDNLVNTATSSGGTGFDVPLNMPLQGNPTVTAGSIWNFQLWHRENGGASNFSNGLAVLY